jgi:hypothetical protein
LIGISLQLGRCISNLTSDEQKLCWDFLEKFQTNPRHPGISMERLNANSGFWSGRVSSDIRAILGKVDEHWMVLHIDHHDRAYSWAERRRLSTHQVTGSLQVVEVLEEREVRTVAGGGPTPGLFASRSDEYLLSLGVPSEWLPTIREIRNDDELLKICERLPQEVGEYLLELADGKLVTPPTRVAAQKTLEHPDTQRNFYLLKSDHELQQFLNAPLAQWRVFLHPDQRKLAYGSFRGPVKVTGGAGTGKTVVGLHRCKHLASQGQRVFLTTYGNSLASYLEGSLSELCTPEELSRIQVSTVHKLALDLCRRHNGRIRVVEEADIRQRLHQAMIESGSGYDLDFLWKEWEKVISPQGVSEWDAYRGARRVGRGKSLTVKERRQVWTVFERFLRRMQSEQAFDFSGLSQLALELLVQGKVRSPFDAVVVDELQDLKPNEIRLLAALAGSGSDRLLLLGDGGQRIYGGRLSLSQFGIETRGRSHILRVNYRTTEQIRACADRVLGSEVDDLDGNRESRTGTRSLFRGPRPLLRGFTRPEEQMDYLRKGIQDALQGRTPEDIAVFAQSNHQVRSLRDQLREFHIPNGDLGRDSRGVKVGTLHRAKGLEFKVVFVVDVSERNMPARSVLDKLDPGDQEDFVEEQRRLLYVGMTRARDELFVSWVGQPSQYLSPVLEDASP